MQIVLFFTSQWLNIGHSTFRCKCQILWDPPLPLSARVRFLRIETNLFIEKKNTFQRVSFFCVTPGQLKIEIAPDICNFKFF